MPVRFFFISWMILLMAPCICFAQANRVETSVEHIQKASKKIEKGYDKNNNDTLALGYFDLGESYYQKGDLQKSETYYQKAKSLYEQTKDAEGIAKTSRALANVQEELHKTLPAASNYSTALKNSIKIGDTGLTRLNGNDINRLANGRSFAVQQDFLEQNINLGKKNKDTGEIINNYSRMADLSLKNNSPSSAVQAYTNAYNYSQGVPEQALKFNSLIADVYLKNKDFKSAIETKKKALKEPFVANSTQLQASEITSLADIYIKQQDDSMAIILLHESYEIAVKNGHTFEAVKDIEKLDSLFRSTGRKDKSLELFRSFIGKLPTIVAADSSLISSKFIADTEEKFKRLELEKQAKDSLIRKKNMLNYWLIATLAVLALFTGIILYMMKKLKVKNQKIALQSLRREMNPHFIFNSLNSVNQFIANNNELAANQYLTKFSKLMRGVMENSKEDLVSFSGEVELLQNYLELEKTRFPDKFDFHIEADDALYTGGQLFIPGMLIQPHLENAIWHGLRYIDKKGWVKLTFNKEDNRIAIHIEDNGIGIAESEHVKTANQKKHNGRGMSNTIERIDILNKLYHYDISCQVVDKKPPATGVMVKLNVPLIKQTEG